ncbi:MADS-box protein SOC1 [Morus notabilis]|uniref:MADS-box protein SOC1 n=1 Tax=Morus notabilis TaxID=981085 RepID=UPI000CED1AAC|nr:MADS-box protein SOC1 [Morus notabilis]
MTEADQQYMQQLRLETANLAKKIEQIEVSKRRFLGRDISSCSYEELQGIDRQLEQSLRKIRARKDHVFNEQIEQLKTKERTLLEENAKLREKSNGTRLPNWQPLIQEKEAATNCSQSSRSTSSLDQDHVETELFIGLPRNSLLITQTGCS